MTRPTLGLLGIWALLFFSAMLSATGAQAGIGAKWLILNSSGQLKEGSTLHASINLEKDSPTLVLHAELLKTKVLFLCTAIKLIEAKLLAEGSIGKEAGVVKGSKLLFSGCTTDLNGVAAPECTPKDPTDGEGTIVTKPLHALILGIGGEDLLRVTPDEGESYVTLVFPATCPLGTSIPVIGKFILKDCENLALTHLVKHLIESSARTELFLISKTPEHTVTLLGSTWALLEGEHSGLRWSSDPGEEDKEEEEKEEKKELPTWLILNSSGQLKEAVRLQASIGLEKDSTTIILHSEILKIKTLFLCTELKAVEAKLLAEGSIGKEAGVVKGSKVLFSGCTTDLKGVSAPECLPTDPTDGKGTIVTKPLHALIVLGASGEDLVEVIPDSGKTFATVALPATCPIGTAVPVIGTLRLKDGENVALTHLTKHLIEFDPSTKLFAISETPEHVATLAGSAWAFLEGEHSGLKWSADPL